MLMSEIQIRLNEVLLKIKRTIDFMGFMQEHHAGFASEQAMAKHAATYVRLVEELEREERQVGGLPRDPDPEFELLEQLFARLKPMLGGDSNEALRQEFDKHLREILDCALYALELDYPPNIRATLREIERYTRALLP